MCVEIYIYLFTHACMYMYIHDIYMCVNTCMKLKMLTAVLKKTSWPDFEVRDWRFSSEISSTPLAFSAPKDHPGVPRHSGDDSCIALDHFRCVFLLPPVHWELPGLRTPHVSSSQHSIKHTEGHVLNKHEYWVNEQTSLPPPSHGWTPTSNKLFPF